MTAPDSSLEPTNAGAAAARQRPQTAVFYSTMRAWVWGAPDYVWPRAAERLLAAGFGVVSVVQRGALERPEVRALARLGAQFVVQVPLDVPHGRLAPLRRQLQRLGRARRELVRTLRCAARPHVFINQGGSFDVLDEPILRPWLEREPVSYDLFFRSNNYGPPLARDRLEAARRLFTAARRCLFNSAWTRDLTELQILQRLPNADIFPHLIRFDYAQPLPWPATEPLRLVSVSRLDTHHKGLDVLLQALALLPAELPPWTFEFFGHGAESAYLRDLSRFLGLDGRVTFHPYATDLPAVWRDRHLLVLVSRYEGLSVAMLEAMACGRPVLRTPYGGAAEWIVPGETGFLCPAPEPALIAASLAESIRAHAQWPAMGRNAHARLRDHLPRDPERVYLQPFGLA